ESREERLFAPLEGGKRNHLGLHPGPKREAGDQVVQFLRRLGSDDECECNGAAHGPASQDLFLFKQLCALLKSRKNELLNEGNPVSGANWGGRIGQPQLDKILHGANSFPISVPHPTAAGRYCIRLSLSGTVQARGRITPKTRNDFECLSSSSRNTGITP